MPMFGPFGVMFFAGLLMGAGGFGLVWTRLARHGGLDREKTLHVVFDSDSPMKRPENSADRNLFRAGIFLVGFGMLTVFSSISAADQQALIVCASACRRDGFQTGRFAPSATERKPDGSPERGCWCVNAAGSTELPQSRLAPPSSPVLPGR